jgi:hypothetical protein
MIRPFVLLFQKWGEKKRVRGKKVDSHVKRFWEKYSRIFEHGKKWMRVTKIRKDRNSFSLLSRKEKYYALDKREGLFVLYTPHMRVLLLAKNATRCSTRCCLKEDKKPKRWQRRNAERNQNNLFICKRRKWTKGSVLLEVVFTRDHSNDVKGLSCRLVKSFMVE